MASGLTKKTNPTGNGLFFFGSGVVLDVGPEKTMALKARKNPILVGSGYKKELLT